MIKKLAKHGNSYAIVISKPIIELLGITDSLAVNVHIEGKALVITSCEDQSPQISTSLNFRDKKIKNAVEKNMKKYAHDLKKLAKN